MKVLKNYLILFGIAGFIVALDQWTKDLVRTNISLGGTWLPEGWVHLEKYFRIVHWYNTGAAFGIFKNGALVFTILAFVVSFAIIWFYSQIDDQDWFLRIPLGMQLGGAIGNLVDRLIFDGKVTDWISVGDFAVFNVADASISVGTAIMLIGVWIVEKRERDALKGNQAQDEGDLENGLETESPSGGEASV